MSERSEFTVENAYQYNRSNVGRWLFSHLWRYPILVVAIVTMTIIDFATFSYNNVLIGDAAAIIFDEGVGGELITATLWIIGFLIITSIAHLSTNLIAENLANRLEVNAREELYRSLLGKSQIYHDRQRVGDIMARATSDVRDLNVFISPGILFVFNTILGIFFPLLYIGLIDFRLLLIPTIFIVTYIISARIYAKRLLPVVRDQRVQYGKMNAGLEESISGIEVIKASTSEAFERMKFNRNASKFRDYFVEQGHIEARYLPLLLFGIALAGTFMHGLYLNQIGYISLANFIAVLGLVNMLRFPTFVSLFSISLLQGGWAGAERILEIITSKTEVDQNMDGYRASINGEITFENVKFDFGDDSPVLTNINFTVNAGQTVAIVGQTGAGKSTLTQLVNRTYDVSAGRILIDGHDVTAWNLASLRSQIANIEQDVFLFSRSLSENIAFGQPNATQEEVEQAAKDAQAHDFIQSFHEGYATEIGDRGVTLSGGQRQRIALARAFLADPRILILDDSTSAIDSATEDEIQKAIRRIQQNRTTLLITHRLSQIRWADLIIVLDKGEIVAQGSHEDLLRTSPHYRRIFSRYDVALPPLEKQVAP